MKKCTLGPRHKWNFLKNITTRYINGSSIRFTQKGVYACECGLKKYGEMQHQPQVGVK